MTYYILGMLSILITVLAQIYIKVTYNKYNTIKNMFATTA